MEERVPRVTGSLPTPRRAREPALAREPGKSGNLVSSGNVFPLASRASTPRGVDFEVRPPSEPMRNVRPLEALRPRFVDTVRNARVLAALLVSSALGLAQIPAGYYNSIDTTNGTTLRSSIHARIKDHTKIPYTASSTDTWDVLESADQNPANAGQILDLYKNQALAKQGGGNTLYNREHTWPNSYGFPNDGADNYPYSDCHHLFLCDITWNADRGNKPYRSCSSGCTEEVTVATNGTGGGSGAYPGNSNWTSSSPTLGSWETWKDRRGDVARALFYLDVRYAGGVHGITGAPEPDLILTDNTALISNGATGNNESVAYMGLLSQLLVWNRQDPPDDKERHRNDVVYSFQGNRNPFIDHPEWVDCIFAGTCAPGIAFCAGDGSLATACPCANTGGTGRGCANSVSAIGALLTATGRQLPADTLVLSASGMPAVASTSAIFLQGDARVVAGAVFGDGVLCASGNLIRLGSKATPTGSALYPESGNPSVSTRGLVTPGSGAMRFYQTYYRNASAAFCPPATFNVTNGFQVVW